ncbi:MAG: hypothetical protein RBS40_08135 [Rhodocyclaceae bacterium]|nr:hypothetical protein [Rhodocyclaceae bacterium]
MKMKPFTQWIEHRNPTLEDAFMWLGVAGEFIQSAQLDAATEKKVKDALEFDVARMLPPTVLTSPFFALQSRSK